MHSVVRRLTATSATVGMLLMLVGSVVLVPVAIAEFPFCGVAVPFEPVPPGCLPGGSSIFDVSFTPEAMLGLALVTSGVLLRVSAARVHGTLDGDRR